MKKYLINKNSDRLLIFFTGWGCDEFEFEHLKSNCDVLILYDYTDLNLDFDFSKYKNFDLLAFSAGVFVAGLFDFDFKPDRKIALSGNPYLFDEHLGLSLKVQNLLYNINEDNAEDFAKNYLIKTDDEWKIFHNSKRTIESCKYEFDCLKEIYKNHKQNIRDIYDLAYFGVDDRLFDISAQREFFKNRFRTVDNARHSLFFRISRYDDIFKTLEVKG